jgi:DNA-directed RNA polymerase beta' subunit
VSKPPPVVPSCPDPAQGPALQAIDKALKKKEISKLIDESFRRCGLKETVVFADKLMQNGYALATRAGISFCSDDMRSRPRSTRSSPKPKPRLRKSRPSTPTVW